MVSDEAVEYAYQLASDYWPGLPRDDFDNYFAVGAEAAILLELEWEGVTGPDFKWQDMSAADRLPRRKVRQFYDHCYGLIFELLRGIGPPEEMWAGDHRANICHGGLTHLGMIGRPVLDYGGGIGQQALFLAARGWQVGFADLGETAAFAEWRFERAAIWASRETWRAGRVRCFTPHGALMHHGWGAIMALDVVEHIPDPVGLLRRFDASLAPDGVLWLTRHSFRPYPTHLPETAFLLETLDDVLAGMGYRRAIEPDGHFGIGAWRK